MPPPEPSSGIAVVQPEAVTAVAADTASAASSTSWNPLLHNWNGIKGPNRVPIQGIPGFMPLQVPVESPTLCFVPLKVPKALEAAIATVEEATLKRSASGRARIQQPLIGEDPPKEVKQEGAVKDEVDASTGGMDVDASSDSGDWGDEWPGTATAAPADGSLKSGIQGAWLETPRTPPLFPSCVSPSFEILFKPMLIDFQEDPDFRLLVFSGVQPGDWFFVTPQLTVLCTELSRLCTGPNGTFNPRTDADGQSLPSYAVHSLPIPSSSDSELSACMFSRALGLPVSKWRDGNWAICDSEHLEVAEQIPTSALGDPAGLISRRGDGILFVGQSWTYAAKVSGLARCLLVDRSDFVRNRVVGVVTDSCTPMIGPFGITPMVALDFEARELSEPFVQRNLDFLLGHGLDKRAYIGNQFRVYGRSDSAFVSRHRELLKRGLAADNSVCEEKPGSRAESAADAFACEQRRRKVQRRTCWHAPSPLQYNNDQCHVDLTGYTQQTHHAWLARESRTNAAWKAKGVAAAKNLNAYASSMAKADDSASKSMADAEGSSGPPRSGGDLVFSEWY